MVDENELREKMTKLETVKSQIQAMEGQKEYVRDLIADHKEAIKTVENYIKQGDDEEMFIPIGGNAHVMSKTEGCDKVLIGIGADVSALTETETAEEIMEKRKKELKQNMTSLANSIDQLSSEYQKLESEVQREYMELQSQMQQG
ncbi:MAG: prefoldin subunit alpha [Thermoplasmata archaeon]